MTVYTERGWEAFFTALAQHPKREAFTSGDVLDIALNSGVLAASETTRALTNRLVKISAKCKWGNLTYAHKSMTTGNTKGTYLCFTFQPSAGLLRLAPSTPELDLDLSYQSVSDVVVPSMPEQTAVIPFHNSALRVAKVDGQVWIAVKPICEHLGIASNAQIEKLRQDSEFQLIGYPIISNDSKTYTMMCLPQEQILGWLYTISSNKISEQAQPILKAYRLETTKAINDYWTMGQATRPIATPVQ